MKTGMSLRSICNFAYLLIIAYPDKKPGCHFAPFAFPMKTGMSLRSICNFAYLLKPASTSKKS